MRILFHDIDSLYSFRGVAKKSGRGVQTSDLGRQRDAAMLVEKGKILWVGSFAKTKTSAFKKKWKNHKKVSLEARSVFPAFVDCHTHMVFAGDRRGEFELRNQGATYQEIAESGGGILSTVKATRKAKFEDLLALAKTREARYLRQGVSTVEIKSGYGLKWSVEKKILEVARSLKKIRTVGTYLGPHSVPPEQSKGEYLKDCLKQLEKLNGLANRVDMFVESGYFTVEEARIFFSRAQELGLSVAAHTDQLSANGASLAMAKLGAQSVDHCVRMTDQEILELAKTKTVAVLLPSSDFYIRIQYPPARRLIESGVPVALATDFNPGSAPSQDLSLTGVLARLEMKMTLPETFAALTFNGTQALGLQNELGSLETGKQADFVVSDESLESFFYDVGFHPVKSLYRSGKRIFSKKS